MVKFARRALSSRLFYNRVFMNHIGNYNISQYLFFVLFILLLNIPVKAQKFRTVPVNSEVLHSYFDPINCPDRECFVSYRTDSFFTDGNDTVIVFDFIVRPQSGLPGDCTHSTVANNWVGRMMRIEHVFQTNYANIYTNAAGDSMRFWAGHHYSLYDTLNVIEFPDGSKIDLVREYQFPQINAFGFSEAARPHVFHYFDSNRIEQPHIINGHQNVITWNLGYFLALNFQRFPFDTSKYIQAGLTRSLPPGWDFLDTLNIKTKHIFDFKLGDEFHYEITERSGDASQNTEQKTFLRIMLLSHTASQTGDTLSLNWFRVKTTFTTSAGVIDTTFVIDTIGETIQLSDYPWLETQPNGFIVNSLFGAGFMDMFREDRYAGRTQKNPEDFFNYDATNNCLSPKSSTTQDPRHHYAVGLGQTSFFEEYANPEYNSLERELIYFQKGLQEWGDPIIFSYLLPVEEVGQIPNSIKVFPNPTSGLVTLFLSKETIGEQLRIQLLNCNSMVIQSITSSSKSEEIQVDLSAQPGGIYFVKVNSESGSIFGVKRILKY